MNPVEEKCPRCGRGTKMERDEVLAYCSSCKSIHEPGERSNVDVEIAKFGNVNEGERIYVPFWRFFCNFSVPETRSDNHKNVKNFVKEGNQGRIFVYVPAADLTADKMLEAGAYLTAVNPSYSTTFSFSDAEHLKCAKSSENARNEVEYYFLSAETAQGRSDDLQNGYGVEPTHEKLVFIPYYRTEDRFTPAV